jgi:hypothetical protein
MKVTIMNTGGGIYTTGGEVLLHSIVLDPGQTAPFRTVLLDHFIQQGDKIQLQPISAIYNPSVSSVGCRKHTITELIATKSKEEKQPFDNETWLLGQVHNKGSRALTGATVIAAALDANGKVVDTYGTIGLEDFTIEPGESRDFEIAFTRKDGKKRSSYQLFVVACPSQ